MKYSILIIALLYFSNTFCQNLIPYIDHKTKLWGFLDSVTKEVKVFPKYKIVVAAKGYAGIVGVDYSHYGLVDLTGVEVVPCTKDLLFTQINDSLFFNQPYECPFRINNETNIDRYFRIDRNGFCIPTSYYPCPYTIQFDSNQVSEGLRFIQKAEDELGKRNYILAFQYAQKAIKAEPSNPAFYFWCSVFLRNGLFVSNPEKNEDIQLLLPMIKANLDSAIKFEKRHYYKLKINSFRHQLYKYVILDKAKSKVIETDLIKYKTNFEKKGLGFLSGYSFTANQQNIEFGLGLMGNTGESKIMSIIFFTPGVSIEYGLKNRIDAYKLYLLAIQTPLNFGLYPIIYTDYSKMALAIRPEIGFGIRNVIFSYGYNFISKQKFPELRGSYISARIMLMPFAKKLYTVY